MASLFRNHGVLEFIILGNQQIFKFLWFALLAKGLL